ncbi:hypothetical protein [uncultured Jannaschia sp.]|uniref:hypothetical protein n=1 Tax=uncultured Jannaschia sp. TaxID=293347 RepID=UPI002607AF5C|nr:hypothetical protein [uncultured Jannaschia sp.]
MKVDREIEGMPKMDQAVDVEQGVWVTDFMQTSSYMEGFTCEGAADGISAPVGLSDAGEEIPAERFPPAMWIGGSFKEPKKLKHIFSAGGLFAVSGAFAEILRRHDLGQNALYPVTFLSKDRTTAYEGEYFFLNICEQKSGFDPERSSNFRDYRERPSPRLGGTPLILDHGDIAVSASVLDGPDLWMDPTLATSHFYKGELARELLAKKMFHSSGTESLSIARCRVIDADGTVIGGDA